MKSAPPVVRDPATRQTQAGPHLQYLSHELPSSQSFLPCNTFGNVLCIPRDAAQVWRSECSPKAISEQENSLRARALTIFDQRPAIRIQIDNFFQVFLRITKTGREYDQVGFESLAVCELNCRALVASHLRHALDQTTANCVHYRTSGHRLGESARFPSQQASWKVLRQPGEVMDVDTQNPMWQGE